MAKKPEKKQAKALGKKDMKKTKGGMGWDVMPQSGGQISVNNAVKLNQGSLGGTINFTQGGG